MSSIKEQLDELSLLCTLSWGQEGGESFLFALRMICRTIKEHA